MAFWIQLLPFLILLIIGLFAGTFVERRHFASLAAREEEYRDMFVTDTKPIPHGCSGQAFGLVIGEVVVASDYFKTFVAGLKKLVGGELRTYESLMERARREALLRMMERARLIGANRVLNVRFASSSIGGMSRRRKKAAMVEMYAYGTAVYVPQHAAE